jgi:C4-type zinc-finger of DNA polymerase delta
MQWFKDMPKIQRAIPIADGKEDKKKGTVDSYYSVVHCFVCHEQSEEKVCNKCMSNLPNSIAILSARLNVAEKKYGTLQSICRSCTGHSTMLDADSACVSIDCPVFFTRKAQLDRVRMGSKWARTMTDLDNKELNSIQWFDF